MKTKKFSKKLVLNKKTIVNLDGRSMSGIIGGLTAVTNCPEDDNCISAPWLCYTDPGYPALTCNDTCYETCACTTWWCTGPINCPV